MIYVCMYLVAIVAANLLVAKFGAAVSIINAFVFIGLDLTSRDKLHDAWHGKHLWLKMTMLIGAGSVLSWFLNKNAGQIALASFCAFAFAGVIDAITYHRLRKRTRLVRMNGSNVFAAIADSIVFPALAFGFPLRVDIMLGQAVAKVLGGFLWSVILNLKFIITSIKERS